MKRIVPLILLIITISILFYGCSKTNDNSYVVSGKVLLNDDTPLEGVLIDCGAQYGTTVTDSTGNWSKTISDNVSVTPKKIGLTFTPFHYTETGKMYTANQTYSTVTYASNDINFEAAPYSGGKIAFYNKQDIYLMNDNGSSIINLTNNEWQINSLDPALSPDGTKICYVEDNSFDQNRPYNIELYTMNVDGSNRTRLTTNTAVDRNPKWSPDGTKIAFNSRYLTASTEITEIKILDLTSNVSSTLAVGGSPTWSPTGDKLAYVDQTGIVTINSDGSNKATIFSRSSNSIGDPAWSPDGAKITFPLGTLLGSVVVCSDLYTIDTNGSNLTQLTFNSNKELAGNPAWSRDSNKIVFDFYSDPYPQSRGLQVMNANGTGLKQLLSPPYSNATYPSWSN